MSEKRLERVRRQHHYFAQILNETDERSSESVKDSTKHLLSWLDAEWLRFGFGPEFGWDRADEARIEFKFAKNRANLAKGDRRLVELEINEVVVAIDFVSQTGNAGELMIEFQDLVQIAQAGSVDFQFQHVAQILRTASVDAKRNDRCAKLRDE